MRGDPPFAQKQQPWDGMGVNRGPGPLGDDNDAASHSQTTTTTTVGVDGPVRTSPTLVRCAGIAPLSLLSCPFDPPGFGAVLTAAGGRLVCLRPMAEAARCHYGLVIRFLGGAFQRYCPGQYTHLKLKPPQKSEGTFTLPCTLLGHPPVDRVPVHVFFKTAGMA